MKKLAFNKVKEIIDDWSQNYYGIQSLDTQKNHIRYELLNLMDTGLLTQWSVSFSNYAYKLKIMYQLPQSVSSHIFYVLWDDTITYGEYLFGEMEPIESWTNKE